MDKIISVIMPVYNQENYLAETIESVLAQSYEDFEFLIMDDGSTDGSATIIRKYASQDKRIIPYYKENTGKCDSTNYLVSEAKGEWCSFLDADDIMINNRLERQIQVHLYSPELDASSCHCIYIDDKGNYMGQQRYPSLKTIEECRLTIKNNQIVLCAFTGLFIRKDVYIKCGGLRSKFWPVEDVEFVNRIIEMGFTLIIIQELLMKYRIHDSSITNSNLWNSFVVRSGYTDYCIQLRRSGKNEISFQDYCDIRAKDSWWIKINRKRFHYSVISLRSAGFALHTKKYLKFLWGILIATAMSPNYVIANIRKRFK